MALLGRSAPIRQYPIVPRAKVAWSDDRAVMYDDERHLYTMASKPLISATGLIKEYEPPFKGSTRRAMKVNNMTDSQVKAMWAEKGEVAQNRGNYIHWALEECIPKRMSSKKFAVSNYCDDEMASYIDEIRMEVGRRSVMMEKVLYSREYGIAGRADMIIPVDGHIVDWKTNRAELDKVYDPFKEPIAHLPNCKLERYKIQIGIYGVLYEEVYKKDARRGTIVHLNDGIEYYKVDMPFYKAVARQLIEHYNGKEDAGNIKDGMLPAGAAKV